MQPQTPLLRSPSKPGSRRFVEKKNCFIICRRKCFQVDALVYFYNLSFLFLIPGRLNYDPAGPVLQALQKVDGAYLPGKKLVSLLGSISIEFKPVSCICLYILSFVHVRVHFEFCHSYALECNYYPLYIGGVNCTCTTAPLFASNRTSFCTYFGMLLE